MGKIRKARALPELGVLGGTFDPIHTGHLIIAEALLEQLNLARVLFLLSALPPHKRSTPIAPWQDRLQMLRLALEGNSRFQVSELEIKRRHPTYTVEAMELLQSQYGERYRVLFVVGADSILEIFSWREPERLLDSNSLVVVPRPGSDLNQLNRRIADRVSIAQTPLIEISSSDIRRRVNQGKSIRYLVPDAVAEYIRHQGLYRKT